MRTWLFAPGHEERKARKALDSEAAVVILDWEDAVPASEKARARQITGDLLSGLDDLERVVVRVNSPASEHFAADAAALVGQPLLAVMLPKAEHPEQIAAAAELGRPLVVLLETALGIERAGELARAHGRVRYLAFGPLDLVADLGGTWTVGGEETFYARSRVAIAARAAGLAAALDGPYPDLRDLAGLRDDTARGRRLGYGGRLLIHPSQIEPVEQAYAASAEDLAFARRVIEAARAGDQQGRGAVAVDGRFVDPPVIRWAQRLLQEQQGDP